MKHPTYLIVASLAILVLPTAAAYPIVAVTVDTGPVCDMGPAAVTFARDIDPCDQNVVIRFDPNALTLCPKAACPILDAAGAVIGQLAQSESCMVAAPSTGTPAPIPGNACAKSASVVIVDSAMYCTGLRPPGTTCMTKFTYGSGSGFQSSGEVVIRQDTATELQSRCSFELDVAAWTGCNPDHIETSAWVAWGTKYCVVSETFVTTVGGSTGLPGYQPESSWACATSTP